MCEQLSWQNTDSEWLYSVMLWVFSQYVLPLKSAPAQKVLGPYCAPDDLHKIQFHSVLTLVLSFTVPMGQIQQNDKQDDP